MIDKVDKMRPDQIWEATLGELQLQLTGATYNTWLGRARLVAYENGTFTIGVHNQYAQDWLENRLDAMIRRTLTNICGETVDVKFVVWSQETKAVKADEREPAAEISTDMSGPDTAPEPRPFVAPELPELNEIGWYPVNRYESMFWRPLLGRVAWSVWEIVRATDLRSKDKKTEWTPVVRWTAPALAEIIGCGKQAIIGASRNSHGHQPGAFDKLRLFSIANVQRQGVEPHIIYTINVLVRLPLLVPVQVAQLPDRLQLRHDQWLAEHGFDPRDWFNLTINK